MVFLNIDLLATGSCWALSYSGQQNLEIGRRNIRGSSHQMDLIVCLLQVATTIMSRGQGSLRNPTSHDEVLIPIVSLPGPFPIGDTQRSCHGAKEMEGLPSVVELVLVILLDF